MRACVKMQPFTCVCVCALHLLFNSSNCTHGGIPIELSQSLELMIKKVVGRKIENERRRERGEIKATGG